MLRLIGMGIDAQTVARNAPEGYQYAPPGYGTIPGRIVTGPGIISNTTVYLLPGDNGDWFQQMVVEASGTWSRLED